MARDSDRGLPAYQYVCTFGHWLGARRPITRCLAWRCPGELKRVGKGARSKQ